MHGNKGCFSSSYKQPFSTKVAAYTWQSPGQSVSPCKLPAYLCIYTSASNSMCSAEYEKALSIGCCKPLLRASLMYPSSHRFLSVFCSLCGEAEPDAIPQSPTITMSPLWFRVGTGLGNWSLWALKAHPTVGWTESPLRRQLLGHLRQAERKGGREKTLLPLTISSVCQLPWEPSQHIISAWRTLSPPFWEPVLYTGIFSKRESLAEPEKHL